MFQRVLTTFVLVSYLVLALGGHALHQHEHVGESDTCCHAEGEVHGSVRADQYAYLSQAVAPEPASGPESQDDEPANDSSDCLTCYFLSQSAEHSPAEILLLGGECAFLEVTECTGIYPETPLLGFMVRGPPAVLLVQS